MGICRVEFAFSLGSPSIEEILLTIWKEHKLQVLVSIVESASIPQKSLSEECVYALTHPKSTSFWGQYVSRYNPIYLFRTTIEGEYFVLLLSEPHFPELMDVVSKALIKLGGEEQGKDQ
ncbi:hypothetical protein EU556_14500 [Hymenobacter fodinae]|uniref:Uncharacterized protein n=1 Tax=Hymenobacter fodinae TaxID=2510796 RepID=A0A4Z0P343_9BACT|nr:hypothetical protein EU556_14500 [Hymenobacter fodinae]